MVWKLSTPPDSEVHVDADVLAMRAPLVQVHRDDTGTWIFDGPGNPQRRTRTRLSAVVSAWPHVAALTALATGGAVVWSWRDHGWAAVNGCTCGQCEPPVATDIDRAGWPAGLLPDSILSVEKSALDGRVSLIDILHTPGSIALLGPGEHHRTADLMAPVAQANVIRRWPHTMRALSSLKKGRLMRWNPETLSWHEHLVA